jgi:hypothetical protein
MAPYHARCGMVLLVVFHNKIVYRPLTKNFKRDLVKNKNISKPAARSGPHTQRRGIPLPAWHSTPKDRNLLPSTGDTVFTFSQAISFVINCRTRKEIDGYWNRLSAGGEQQPCGWLKDKYGVSWQVVPVVLAEMLNNPDTEKSRRFMQAMLKMDRPDIKNSAAGRDRFREFGP